MIPLVAAAMAQTIEFSSEHMLADKARICGWYDVSASGSGYSVQSRYACYDIERKQLQLHQATLKHSLGEIVFLDGVLDADQQFWLNAAQISLPVQINASQIVGKQDRFVMQDIELWPCPCGQWSIKADAGILEDDWIYFRRPHLKIGETEVTIPKRRISTTGKPPILPQVSWEEGPWVRQGFRGVSGGAGWGEYRAILGPSVHYAQPVDLESFEFTPQLHLGFHEKTESLRGSFGLTEKDSQGWLQSSIQSQLVTDDAYLMDYGTSYMARQQPFLDQRLWLAAAPFRLEIQQVSLEQEPIPRPMAVLEDSILIGPFMSYAYLGLPLEGEEPLNAAGQVGWGRDGRFFYSSAFINGWYSPSSSGFQPQLRGGSYGYADIKSLRFLGRYGLLWADDELYLETQHNVLRGHHSKAWVKGRIAANDDSDYQIEGALFGRVPLYVGARPGRYWLSISHRVLQPAMYWWNGAIALVGQANIVLPNQRTRLSPAAVYFPQQKEWQSIGLGVQHFQPQNCLEEQFSIQWMPDRKWPVFRFQLSMKY